jgi:hypothetical protein
MGSSNESPNHRYKIINEDGVVEFLWNHSKRPTKKDFEDLLSFFREQHPELNSDEEEELDQIDLDKADQKTFEKVRAAQEMKGKRKH